jgi:hypothetical protein
MPHFSFPLSPDGLIVQAVFGLNGRDTATLVRTGQPIPRPVQVRALLDNGTDATAIAPHVFQRLGLTSRVSGSTQTAAGPVQVNVYRVSLTIAGPAGITGPVLALPELLASELAAALPNIDALIGMDVLRQCLLVLDGPGQQFLLGF